jgi:hypothetical protein
MKTLFPNDQKPQPQGHFGTQYRNSARLRKDVRWRSRPNSISRREIRHSWFVVFAISLNAKQIFCIELYFKYREYTRGWVVLILFGAEHLGRENGINFQNSPVSISTPKAVNCFLDVGTTAFARVSPEYLKAGSCSAYRSVPKA